MASSAGAARRSILLVGVEPLRDPAAARLLFEAAGFRVVPASTFDDAKRLLDADPPDVLVTELKLGAYNGLHLVLRSRADHPHMGVIVLSHFADAGLAAEAARCDAAFLVRPFAADDLLDAVHLSLCPGGPRPSTSTAPLRRGRLKPFVRRRDL